MGLGTIFALFKLLRVGECVADPKKWKQRQITISVLTPILAAAIEFARTLGVDVPISDKEIDSIAGGILAVINVVLTATTSTHAGLLPAAPATDSGPVDAKSTAVPAANSVSPFNDSTGA